MNADDNTYNITRVIYDVNICDLSIGAAPLDNGNRIQLTATVRDNQNNPPATPQTVYWSCPRSVVQFSDKTGTITSTSQTDSETGEATIYVSSPKVALALVSASLNPNGTLPFNIQVVFCTIAPNLESSFGPPAGASLIQLPSVHQDHMDNFSYKFVISPKPAAKNSAAVAGWTAQIDQHGAVLEKTLLFPVGGQNNRYTWGALQRNGLNVPYQDMNLTDGLTNVVQYLYQDGSQNSATVSKWFSYGAEGLIWAQPDPHRVINPKYPPPVVWNPNRNREENGSYTITNDYFWWNERHKTYWLTFRIHTDTLNAGDILYLFIYSNGFIVDTTERISYYTRLSQHTVTTDASGANEIVAVMIPANPLVTIASGIGNNYGQLDLVYFVNQIDWSTKFQAPTQFDPDNLEPPKEAFAGSQMSHPAGGIRPPASQNVQIAPTTGIRQA
ncbi:hypothetical protein DUT91_03550 [Phyllobacterium salinisoli]|uniref:Big-1 domain-containing protein n=1 Tax=Phyllobacterium salinisoli TaxID=1899321 RepID=A0A368K914_9HYPH|nr:Ig-like domain-containing protein [Phyllobacterium salinisoli]RCS25846.1 hypothetical protein DUT91_03550 [Phyllobacterium salinisoli]